MAAARRSRGGDTGRRRPAGATRRAGAVGTRRRGPVGTTRREGAAGTRRRPPVAGGSGKAVFLFLLLLIGVLSGGAAFALREDITALIEEIRSGKSGDRPTPPVVDPMVKTPTGQPVVQPPPEQPVVQPPPEQPVVQPPPEQPVIKPPRAPDEADALAAIAKGEETLAAGKFAQARSRFGEVELMECEAGTKKKAADLAKRAAAFMRLVRHLTVSPMATKQTHRIKVRNRDAFEGFYEKLPDGSYRIVRTDGKGSLTFTLKAELVESIKTVSVEEKRQRFLTELKRLRGRLKDQTPVTAYELAAFAWEHALAREAAREFSRAHKLAEDKGRDLVRVVYDDQADRLLGHARWYETVGRVDLARPYVDDIVKFYPDSRAAADAKALRERLKDPAAAEAKTFKVETDRPTDEPPKPDSERTRPIKIRRPSPREEPRKVTVHIESIESAASGGEMAKADAAFKAGMEAYLAGLREHEAGRNFVPRMREARRHFGKALPVYQKAAERDPNNGRLQKRARETGFYFHQAGRMLPL